MAIDPVSNAQFQVNQANQDWAPPPQTEEEGPETGTGGPGVEGGGNLLLQVQQEARSIIGNWAKQAGFSQNAADAFVNANWTDARNYLRKHRSLNPSERQGPFTMETFNVALDLALSWYGARLPFSVDPGTGSSGSGSGRRRGGGGPRKPTADEIRAQFDVDDLARRVNDMSRVFLIKDHESPRSVANAYVEAIVKNPDQKLEFETFVQGQLKKDARWNVIMQNKPNGMDEAQYIQRYAQQVMGALGGGDEASQIAFEQAALGSSAGGVQERLGRTRQARASSDFVNGFEDQIRGVSEMLR